MYNELTKVDIEKMKEEIAERRSRVSALREEVRRTREFGDLSENDEYRSAKREYNKNNGRIRYLENMINTAKIIEVESAADTVGLFDFVTIYYPEDEETRIIRLVTTLRNDVLSDCISKDSPFGRAVLGAKVGDTVQVEVREGYSYPVEIKKIEKGQDDDSLPISKY
jgi:transcription elongation factor GreA